MWLNIVVLPNGHLFDGELVVLDAPLEPLHPVAIARDQPAEPRHFSPEMGEGAVWMMIEKCNGSFAGAE
jgi:hypothetical protein